MCVCVCVCAREKARECVCVCAREKEREGEEWALLVLFVSVFGTALCHSSVCVYVCASV